MKTRAFARLGSIILLAFMTVQVVSAQVKIGSNPTTIGANNNLEVEASTSGRKVSIDKTTGKVTIADGSQGNDRILTSDVNGTATWKPMAESRATEVVFIGELTSEYIVTDFNGTFNAQKDRLPLIPRAGSLPGWDATTKEYTIQETGYYRVYGGSYIQGTRDSSCLES